MGFGLLCRLGQVGRKVDTKQLGSPVGGGGFWRSRVGAEEEEPRRKHLQHWCEERMEKGESWVGRDGRGKMWESSRAGAEIHSQGPRGDERRGRESWMGKCSWQDREERCFILLFGSSQVVLNLRRAVFQGIN